MSNESKINICIKEIFKFLVLFLAVLLFNYYVKSISTDEIWNYGFSYNIANGLIPYKDFNMIVLPFYQLFIALFLKLFGSSLLMYHFINAFFITLSLVIISKNKYNNIFVVITFIILCGTSYGYNMYSNLILMIILFLENNNFKYKNIIIGLLIGSVLMTKINLGLFLLIPYFIFFNHKIKSILYVLIIPIFILIYLLFNNILYECIDYCFLGLKNFVDNFFITWVLVVEIIVISYLIYKFIKTKNKCYVYLIFYQGMCYPLFDTFHFLLAIIPVIYYLINYSDNKYIKLFINTIGIFIFSILIFSIFTKKITRNFPLKIFVPIENYIEENKDKKIFIFSSFSYIVKLDLKMDINKYDLINKGNMGKDEDKYIKEIDNICSKEECLFMLNPEEFDGEVNQLYKPLKDYVVNNYELVTDEIYFYNVYGNKVSND